MLDASHYCNTRLSYSSSIHGHHTVLTMASHQSEHSSTSTNSNNGGAESQVEEVSNGKISQEAVAPSNNPSVRVILVPGRWQSC